MAYANPNYDPEWKATHDRHAVERARAGAERDRLAKSGAMLSDAYRQAEAEFDHHQRACLASFKTQHATVQEYAAWVFREFKVSSGDWEGGIPVPQVDFAQLRTIEETDAAWSRVHRIVSDSAAERRSRLPTGQPEGLRAFADPVSLTLTRYWREFSPHDLYPSGYARDAGTWTLMTVDVQEDRWHVCFMHNWGGVGVSVTNAIERLATAVHREACAIAEQQAPKAIGIRAWLTRLGAGRRRTVPLAPDRFHFYQHIPPHGLYVTEQFDRVDMVFREGEYREPKWVGYQVIPEVIQSARFDCALDASLLSAQPRLAIPGQAGRDAA